MAIETIQPDGDITTGWTSPAPHWSKLNEDPSTPDGSAIIESDLGDGNMDEWSFESIRSENNVKSGQMTQAVLNVYGKRVDVGSPEVDFYDGSTWKGSGELTPVFGTSYGWHLRTYSSLGISASVGLKMRIWADTPTKNLSVNYVDTIYIDITFKYSRDEIITVSSDEDYEVMGVVYEDIAEMCGV